MVKRKPLGCEQQGVGERDSALGSRLSVSNRISSWFISFERGSLWSIYTRNIANSNGTGTRRHIC